MKRIILVLCVVALCTFTTNAAKPGSKTYNKLRCDSLKRRCDSLQFRCDSLQQEMMCLNRAEEQPELPVQQDARLRRAADSLQTVIDGLYPVRKMLAEDIITKYKDYPNYEFSKQNPKELDSVLIFANTLKIEELTSLATELNEAKMLKIKFDSLFQIVNRAYDKDSVESAKPIAQSLLSQCKSAQTTEVKQLETALNTYHRAVGEVKGIVEWIHETMELYRPGGNPEAARSSLNSILTNQNGVIKSVVNKVPYLRDLFGKMVADLENDPIRKGEAEEELLNL